MLIFAEEYRILRYRIFQPRLAEADKIEGYPDLYDRSVVDVEVLDPSGQPLGTEQAWVYHRTGTFERSAEKRIPDGDWLSRRRTVSAE